MALWEIRTLFRRPCLLRAIVESNIDAPEGKRSPPPDRDTFPFSSETGGSNGIDHRALTLDAPARLSPRCSGLHKRGFDSTPQNEKSSKKEQIQTLQALGIYSNLCDLDLTMKLKPRDESVERMRRTKIEELAGVPLSGKGANLEVVGGRRVSGFRELAEARDASDREGKLELHNVSIEHQFNRRHFSTSPVRTCTSDGSSDHVVRAEGYANLLGRPEGNGRRLKRSKSERTIRGRPAFRYDPRPAQDFAFPPAAQREEVVSTPRRTTAGQDVVAEEVPCAVSSPKRSSRMSSPPKAWANPYESPRRSSPWRISRGAMGRNSSDASLMSFQSTADTEGGTSKAGVGSPGIDTSNNTSHNTSQISSPPSPSSPQKSRGMRRSCGGLEDEWKARRRAAWVA